jgi:hypothetical protein
MEKILVGGLVGEGSYACLEILALQLNTTKGRGCQDCGPKMVNLAIRRALPLINIELLAGVVLAKNRSTKGAFE